MTDDLKVSRTDWEGVKKGLLSRWLERKGIIIKKPLIYAGFAFLTLIFIYAVLTEGGVRTYWVYECKDDRPCPNPFHPECNVLYMSCVDEETRRMVCSDDPSMCLIPYLPAGYKAGREPPPIYQNFDILLISTLAVVYGLNMLLYNRPEQRRIRRGIYEREKRAKSNKY